MILDPTLMYQCLLKSVENFDRLADKVLPKGGIIVLKNPIGNTNPYKFA
jgi:hypothetical protein